MPPDPATPHARRRTAPPLDQAALDALALAYVARFATSAGRLLAYLDRKLRARGWAGDAAPDTARIVARMVDLGYVNDAGYAVARGAALRRRGLGARRIGQALAHDGIAEDDRALARGTEREARAAALAYARRRRLGPFGRGSDENPHAVLDRAARARQVAAMLRAGHRAGDAARVIDSRDPDALQEWVEEADDDGI